MFSYVHSGFIHNNQTLETTKMPLNWRMDKENVVHLHISIDIKNDDIMKFAEK